MSDQLKPEKKCPVCGGPIDWKVIRGSLGEPQYNGLCKKCLIVLRGREVPEVTTGKALESNGKIGGDLVRNIHAMDKKITRLPCDIQVGILRERHRRELEEAKP